MSDTAELQKKAETGCIDSQWEIIEGCLDNCSEKDKQVFADFSPAIFWLEKLAKSEVVRAQVLLGEVYSTAVIGNPNPDLGYYWYRKAAEKNNAEAQYELGKYCEGRQDYERAAGYYKLAWKQKYLDASTRIKLMYVSMSTRARMKNKPLLKTVVGEKGFVKRSSDREKLKKLEKKAKEGCSESQWSMAQLCLKIVKEESYSESRWIMGLPYTHLGLHVGRVPGLDLYGGSCVPGLTEGLFWLEKAAESGVVLAQLMMGDMYSDIEFYPSLYDPPVFCYWYTKAANKNNAKAQYKLGKFCEERAQTVEDYERTASYYKLASEQGYWDAATKLSFVYEKLAGFYTKFSRQPQ